MYGSDNEESSYATGFTALFSSISIFSLSASVLKIPEDGEQPLHIDDTVLESSINLRKNENYNTERKWNLEEKCTFRKKKSELFGQSHWINKWQRRLSLPGTTPPALQRRRSYVAVETPSNISMNKFLAEEAEEKELYCVTLHSPGRVLNRGAVYYTGGGIGLSLGIRSDGKVIVTALNSIEESSETSESIRQPSPAQIHGGISVGDCLLKINKISLQNLNFMQLTNILNRIEELLKDGVVLQLQYEQQKDDLQFIQEVSHPSHAVGEIDSASTHPAPEKKSTPNQGHTNLFLANLFTENYTDDTLSEESYMGMRLGRLQQFYDDFCNLQFSPKYINQKINFGDVLQTCIRKSHTYPIAARTNSIAHNRSTDILLRELAAEVFEWRPRYLSFVYGGFFRAAQYPLLIRTPADKASYKYTKVLVWDPMSEKYVFSDSSSASSGGSGGAYQSYRDVIRLDEIDDNECNNISVSIIGSEEDADPFGIFRDVEEVVVALPASEDGNNQPIGHSVVFHIISKTSEDFLALSKLLNERMLGCAGNNRPENRLCILAQSHCLQVFMDSLQDTTNDCDHILESLTHAVDVELALEKLDGDAPIQLTHAIFIALQLFPEAILNSFTVVRCLLKWQKIISGYISHGSKSNGSKPDLFRKYVSPLDLNPFYSICSDLLTLLYSLWMCKDNLLLDHHRTYSNAPDYLISKLSRARWSKHLNNASDNFTASTWDISKFDLLPIQITRQSHFNPLTMEQDIIFQSLDIEEFIHTFSGHLNLDMVVFMCGVVARKKGDGGGAMGGGGGDGSAAIVRQLDCIQTCMRRNEHSNAVSAVCMNYCSSSEKIVRSARDPGDRGEMVMKDIQEYSRSMSRKSRHSFGDTLRHLQRSMSSRSLVATSRDRKESNVKLTVDPDGHGGKQLCIWLCACVFNLKEMFLLNEERALEISVELSFLIDPALVMYIFFHSVDMDSVIRQFEALETTTKAMSARSSEDEGDMTVGIMQKYFKYLNALWKSKRPDHHAAVILAVDLLKVSLLLHSHIDEQQPVVVSTRLAIKATSATAMRSPQSIPVNAAHLADAVDAVVHYLTNTARSRTGSGNSTITSQLCPLLADCIETCARFNHRKSVWDLLCVWVDTTVSMYGSNNTEVKFPFCWGSEKVRRVISKVIGAHRIRHDGYNVVPVTVLDRVKSMSSSLRTAIHLAVQQALQSQSSSAQGSPDLSGLFTSYWLLLLLRRLYESACDQPSTFDPCQLEEVYNSALAVLKTDIENFMDNNGNGDSSTNVAHAVTVSLIDSLHVTGAIALLEQLPCCANFLISATFFSSVLINN